MPPKVNLRSTAVKRIMQEAAELSEPDQDFVAQPLDSDIFEWHCTLRGVPGTEYEGGLYHLRVLLPATYPMSAPDIVLMTPSGRFEPGKKICIDGLTSFHAGSWQPAWGVRTAMAGLRSFWTQGGEALAAIGALDYPKEERRRLARLSRDWVCPTCGVPNHELLPDDATPANAEASGSGTTGADATETVVASKSEAEGQQEITEPQAPSQPSEATLPERPTPTEDAASTSRSHREAENTPSAAVSSTEIPLPPVHGPTNAIAAPVPPPIITEPVPTPTPTTPATAEPAAAPLEPTHVRSAPSAPPPQPGARPVPPSRVAAAPSLETSSSSPPPPVPAARPVAPPAPAVTGAPAPAPASAPAPAPQQVAANLQQRRQRESRSPPLWLDGSIGLCVAVLLYLLARQ